MKRPVIALLRTAVLLLVQGWGGQADVELLRGQGELFVDRFFC